MIRIIKDTLFFTRQLYTGHTAETELLAVIDHPLCSQLHPQLYHTRIDRKFYNILKRYQSHAFPVPIAYRTVGDLNTARIIDHRGRRNNFFRQSHHAHNRLENRARFVNSRNRAISPAGSRIFIKSIRVKTGPIGHAQNRARIRVHQDDRRTGGFRILHRLIQRILQHKLDLAVQGQID